MQLPLKSPFLLHETHRCWTGVIPFSKSMVCAFCIRPISSTVSICFAGRRNIDQLAWRARTGVSGLLSLRTWITLSRCSNINRGNEAEILNSESGIFLLNLMPGHSVVADANNSPTIYLVQSKNRSPRVEIASFRHTDHPLAGTLLRHLAHEITREANQSKLKVVVVTDAELSDEAKAALAELGFLPDVNAWWKISVAGLISRDELVAEIRSADIPASLKERLVGAIYVTPNADDEYAVARLENLFSPAKLISSVAPCYVVSIRQSWAAHFFDIPIGGQTLMDLNERLHLGIEGAYYCSAHNTHVTAPGRVLWYVSGKGSMSIKACSHLEERTIGKPKELFAQYRHLGVYAWKHVLETTDGNLDHPLMALRFSRTERFARPITLAELQQMDIPQPQNPRRITAEQFASNLQTGDESLKI